LNSKEFTGFILLPEKLVFSFSRTHLAIEFYGSDRIVNPNLVGETQIDIHIHDYSQTLLDNNDFFDKIIGMKFDGTAGIRIPISSVIEDLVFPTDKGADKLQDLNWNYAAQNSIIGFNTSGFFVPEGEFARLVNCVFFDADDYGLITRRVKMIDFLPLIYDDKSDQLYDSFKINLSYYDKHWLNDLFYKYPLPEDFKYQKLQQVNRFIEYIGSTLISEPQITSYLNQTENKFILCNAFFAKSIYHQLKCEWQSEDKIAIIPDFFIEKPNGYCDIVEFKLPTIKSTAIVGNSNRERFSSELSSYVAQTRVYKSYFNDPNNRKWFKEKYGLIVNNPRRYLVIGRRSDFDTDTWVDVKSEYPDLEIVTYDDLVDGVITQYYI
jgi:hypothetical protein